MTELEKQENENRLVKSTATSAVMIMVSMIISRILGFVRDMIIYAKFGQGMYTDAYNAAFKIPDFIYMILVGGAFSAAFIPVISSYVAKNKQKEAWEVASITLNVVCAVMLVLVGVVYFLTPWLLSIWLDFKDPQTMLLTIKLTRIMLLQVVFMALAGICSGILQSFKIFGPTAYGGVVYNLGIIVVGAIFSGVIEKHFPGFGIAAFSIGVVAGALGNFLIQAVSLKKIGIHYSPSFDIHHEGFQRIIGLMVPVLIGLSASELGIFINYRLGSSLEEGLLTAFASAQRFMQLPISIFAISIAMTLFPVLTSHAAKNKIGEFRKDYSQGIRTIFFICIPCSVLLGALGVPFIRLLFETGKFTPESTQNTAFALYFFVIGIFAQGGIHLSSRAFYALQNTKTPVIMAIIGVGVNIALSLVLVKVLAQGGLALAYSISGVVNLFLLMWVLRKKIGGIDGRNIAKSFVLVLCASAVMGVVAYFTAWGLEATLGIANKGTQFAQLMISGFVGVGVFLVIAKCLKIPETDAAIAMVKRRFKRK
ncbi:MAG: murein biosynthesis integral membrane protein MurJ [Clostridiales bacterium]